jgi:cytochrome c peroxidase
MIKKYSRRTLLYWLGSSLFLFISFVTSCKKNTIEQLPISFVQPANFPQVIYKLANNPITKNGFELGRTLFYDVVLSKNNTISCGNCHQQGAAFANADHAVSHGIFDRLGTRNAPALQNLAFYNSFMWDGGVFDLDLQPIAPIESHEEMDEQLNNIVAKLNQLDKYKKLFSNAYGSNDVTTAKLLKALSQFMVMMVSANSKYDKKVRNEVGGNFTVDENEGLQLFKAKCQSCHSTDLFTDQSFRNNGLPPTGLNDLGRYSITLNDADKYKFKVPSLRNVAITAPYMHDGRFRLLEAVLDHYQTGITDNITLDSLLKLNGAIGIALTNAEKSKIILFLKTLTDEEYIRDRRFAEQ